MLEFSVYVMFRSLNLSDTCIVSSLQWEGLQLSSLKYAVRVQLGE